MKTKLLTLKAAGFALLLSSQVNLAQTGGSFNGPHNAGLTSSIIQFEDFNLGANQDATANPTGTAPFGYSDLNAGLVFTETTQLKKSTYRENLSDVELLRLNLLSDPTYNDAVLVNSAVAEFLYYTVNFTETGKYSIDVNYGHGNANPRAIKFESVDTDLLNPVVLVDGTVIKIANSYTMGTNPVTDNSNSGGATTNGNTLKFDIAATGNYIIKVTTVNNGPNYNWFQFKREGDLSTNAFDKGANALEVYPNPSNNGLFNLSIESKWEVYSVLGAKIAEGEGTKVDLSNAAKGAYILKTGNTSKKLIVN